MRQSWSNRGRSTSASDDSNLRQVWKSKVDNIVLAWKEYGESRLQLESRPFRAIVELTQNCNFRCVMCPQSWEERFKHYNPDYNLSEKLFERIANELFPSAIFVDLRGFGETTILPYWGTVLDRLLDFPLIDWHLVTNLGLPRPSIWDQMIKLGFTLGFSCDGATAETFESIRVRSKFKTIEDNLATIRDARQQYGRGFIYFISTIQRKNLSEMRGIVELAGRYEVPEVQFKVVQTSDPAISLNSANRDEIRDRVKDAVSVGLELGIRITFNDWIFSRDIAPELLARVGEDKIKRPPSAFTGEVDSDYWVKSGVHSILDRVWHDSPKVTVNQRCFKPFSYTYVDYQGKVGTCNHMMFPYPRVMGDLSAESFGEIWNGAKYQEFRKELLTACPTDSRCQWCFKHRMED